MTGTMDLNDPGAAGAPREMDTAADVMGNYRETLQALERVRDITQGYDLSFPQICVVGNQSSGKSTLLGSVLPGLDEVLPRAAQTCTRRPIIIRLTRRLEAGNRAPHGDAGYANYVKYGNQEFAWTEDERKNAFNALTVDQKGPEGKEFTDVPLSVTVINEDAPELVLVDLPGIIGQGAGKDDIMAMIPPYINKAETLILVVVTANDDMAMVAAEELAKKADPHGARTLQVLTKCDNFSEEANKEAKVRLVSLGLKDEMGPHMVCSRPHGGGSAIELDEEAFFNLPESKTSFSGVQERCGSKRLLTERLPKGGNEDTT